MRVDIEAQAELATASGVKAVPHFAIWRHGHVVERLMGCNAEAVAAALERHIAIVLEK